MSDREKGRFGDKPRDLQQAAFELTRNRRSRSGERLTQNMHLRPR